MSKDEVELGQDAGEDYEVVPVGPIRKLERRLDEIEEQSKNQSGGPGDDYIHDVLDIMKSNQKIVNDMTESTHELKNEVEDLTHKMDQVIDNMNSFMDLLQEASETDLEGEVIQDVHTRIADAVGNQMQDVANDMKESNDEVIKHLQELNKSVKRSYTSQTKDDVLSRSSNNSRQRNQNKQQNQRNSSGSGLNMDRNSNNQSRQQNTQPGQGQGQSQSNRQQNQQPERSDRMRKLRERFDKKSDEQ